MLTGLKGFYVGNHALALISELALPVIYIIVYSGSNPFCEKVYLFFGGFCSGA